MTYAWDSEPPCRFGEIANTTIAASNWQGTVSGAPARIHLGGTVVLREGIGRDSSSRFNRTPLFQSSFSVPRFLPNKILAVPISRFSEFSDSGGGRASRDARALHPGYNATAVTRGLSIPGDTAHDGN